MGISLAVKCAPEEKIFLNIKRAGIGGVELYVDEGHLLNAKEAIALCRDFPFQYAIHAPRRGFNPSKLEEFCRKVSARLLIFHNIYWQDEWQEIAKVFKGSSSLVCVENITHAQEPLKFMRRFGFAMCLDMEHLQMECCGVFEEEFIPVIRMASHIHLTGYISGGSLWHTHFHHSPRHSTRLLGLVKRAGYSGLVVSEARTSLQTYSEFRDLRNFFEAVNKGKPY